jgi:chemotaxis signal transduction protein
MAKENLTLVVYLLETDDKAYEYGIPISQVHEITRPGNVTSCRECRTSSTGS